MSVEDLVSAIAALPPPERQRAYARLDQLRGAEPGAHERARHLAGSVPGPADLSSNKDHLRGFGERRSAPRP